MHIFHYPVRLGMQSHLDVYAAKPNHRGQFRGFQYRRLGWTDTAKIVKIIEKHNCLQMPHPSETEWNPTLWLWSFRGADSVKLGFTTFLNRYGSILTFRGTWHVNIRLFNAVQPMGNSQAKTPTGLKRFLKSSIFPRRIRFGCKPNLPSLGWKIWANV